MLQDIICRTGAVLSSGPCLISPRPSVFFAQCSRSKAYQPALNDTPSPTTRLRVYVYELPTSLAFEWEKYAGFRGYDPIYVAYKLFLTR